MTSQQANTLPLPSIHVKPDLAPSHLPSCFQWVVFPLSTPLNAPAGRTYTVAIDG